MHTMLSVAYEFLETKEEATFTQIWKEVIKKMKPLWKVHFPTLLIKDIEDKKISELHTLLTVDGRFTKTKKDVWVLIENYTYEEVKQMKVNVGESLD